MDKQRVSNSDLIRNRSESSEDQYEDSIDPTNDSQTDESDIISMHQ